MRSSDDRACKLCGGATRFRFELDLAETGLRGEYFECKQCRLLQSYHLDSLSPAELDNVYDSSRWAEDPDPGAAWRLAHVARKLEILKRLGMLPRSPTGRNVLDFGSGSGFIVAYVAHRFGGRVAGYEPYVAPSFASERILRDWESVVDQGPYNLVIASEVFEHFTRPREQIEAIRDVLADPAALFLTTGRYIPGTHGIDWSYLAPHSGHHVAFYAEASLAEIGRILDLPRIYQVGAGEEWLLTRSGSTWSTIHLDACSLALRLGTQIARGRRSAPP